MTPNRITRLIFWVAYYAIAVCAGLVVGGWIVKSCGIDKPQPKPTASIPAIPKVDFNAADRAMIQQIHAWVEDQREAKADFERDMKAGRIPRLPGVGR